MAHLAAAAVAVVVGLHAAPARADSEATLLGVDASVGRDVELSYKAGGFLRYELPSGSTSFATLFRAGGAAGKSDGYFGFWLGGLVRLTSGPNGLFLDGEIGPTFMQGWSTGSSTKPMLGVQIGLGYRWHALTIRTMTQLMSDLKIMGSGMLGQILTVGWDFELP